MRELGLVAQPTSTAIIIENVGPGAVFGEGSALGCSRRLDEAISRDQTELLTIPGEDFRQTLSLVPNLRWRVLKRYVEYLIKSVYHDKVKLCLALLEMQLPELVEGRTYEAPQSSHELVGHARGLSIDSDWREILVNLRETWEARFTKLEPLMLNSTRHAASPQHPPKQLPRASLRAEALHATDAKRQVADIHARIDALHDEMASLHAKLDAIARATALAPASPAKAGALLEPLGAPSPLGASASPPAS